MQQNELQHLVWAINDVVTAAKHKADSVVTSDQNNKELQLLKIINMLQDMTSKSANLQWTTVDGIAFGTVFYSKALDKI
jgi:hypothetical protein